MTQALSKNMSKRQQVAKADIEKLMHDPAFKRFLWTVFDNCGMWAGNYRADGRHLQFLEGRRSLGLDILRTIEPTRPDALSSILLEEMKTLQENPDGRRTYNRNDELDRDAAVSSTGIDGNPAGSGLTYLDYGNAADTSG